jgi:hypothetical protein
MIGFPPNIAGLIVIRSSSFCSSIAATPRHIEANPDIAQDTA